MVYNLSVDLTLARDAPPALRGEPDYSNTFDRGRSVFTGATDAFTYKNGYFVTSANYRTHILWNARHAKQFRALRRRKNLFCPLLIADEIGGLMITRISACGPQGQGR